MNKKIKELSLKCGMGMIGESKLNEYTTAIVNDCIQILEQYDPKFAIKKLKETYEIKE